MIALIICGILAGTAAAVIAAGIMRPQPKLSSALERLGSTEVDPTPRTRQEIVSQWVLQHLPASDKLHPTKQDLSITGKTLSEHTYEKLLASLIVVLVLPLLGAFLQMSGITSFAMPALLAVPAAVGVWMLSDQQVRAKAARLRDQYARACAIYIELVAVERRRGAPADVALEAAAKIGRTPIFARILDELNTARLAGIRPWTALRGLSERVGVPELADIADIVKLSGEQGSASYETLRGRGRTLRIQQLHKDAEEANSASEKLTIPLVGLAFIFMGIIITPMLLNLITTS